MNSDDEVIADYLRVCSIFEQMGEDPLPPWEELTDEQKKAIRDEYKRFLNSLN